MISVKNFSPVVTCPLLPEVIDQSKFLWLAVLGKCGFWVGVWFGSGRAWNGIGSGSLTSDLAWSPAWVWSLTVWSSGSSGDPEVSWEGKCIVPLPGPTVRRHGWKDSWFLPPFFPPNYLVYVNDRIIYTRSFLMLRHVELYWVRRV